MIHCNGVSFVLHYLDDFLIFSPPGSELTFMIRSRVEAIFSRAGMPIAHKKTEKPSTILMFLSIEINTDMFQLRLSREKVDMVQRLTG